MKLGILDMARCVGNFAKNSLYLASNDSFSLINSTLCMEMGESGPRKAKKSPFVQC